MSLLTRKLTNSMLRGPLPLASMHRLLERMYLFGLPILSNQTLSSEPCGYLKGALMTHGSLESIS
jgi:hypothetical protein